MARTYRLSFGDNEDLARRLAKARAGEYDTILLRYSECGLANSSSSDFSHAKLERIVEKIYDLGFAVQIQMSLIELAQFVNDRNQIERLCRLQSATQFSVVCEVENIKHGDDVVIRQATQMFSNLKWLFVLNKKFKLRRVLNFFSQHAPGLLEKSYWIAPIKHTKGDQALHATQVYRALRSVRAHAPQINIQPWQEVDIYNPQVDPASELESLTDVQYITEQKMQPPTFSVVIPTYNNRDYLICTLRHLLRQNMTADEYEVIIVDDGSDDGTREALQQELSNASGGACVKYIYFARNKKRSMGDFQFRAGVARNLGVKQARGEFITFLDSDIVVPRYFLSDLKEKHKNHDVIQTKRLHLTPNASSLSTEIDNINVVRDTLVVEEGYWDIFHAVADWEALPDKWKYVCTYSLSMPIKLFKQVGWFRKNYCVYGYEDTDLGFRLARAGCRFYLNKIDTFHLHHLDSRSEFMNSFYKKRLLLQHSAKVFYANTLDDSVYEHLSWVLQKNLGFKLYVYDQLRKVLHSRGLKLIRKAYWFVDYQLSFSTWENRRRRLQQWALQRGGLR